LPAVCDRKCLDHGILRVSDAESASVQVEHRHGLAWDAGVQEYLDTESAPDESGCGFCCAGQVVGQNQHMSLVVADTSGSHHLSLVHLVACCVS
jgi:hypothetical protein